MNESASHSRAAEILLIEDTWADAVLNREALAEACVQNNLSTVKTGKEAMQSLSQEDPFHDPTKPDIIRLDLNLPGMSGQEVLRWIKNHEPIADIPVIVLMASYNPDDIKIVYREKANC